MAFTYTNNEQLIIELKKLMLEEKISQREIAQALNMKPQGLTKLLSKKNFSFDDAQRILNVMNHSLEITFHRND